MSAARGLLAKIDAIAEQVRQLRIEVLDLIGDTSAPVDTDTPADLADQHLVDTATVSERFGVPADMARRWCRDEGCGVKRGGRWLASIPRFRRRLDGG